MLRRHQPILLFLIFQALGAESVKTTGQSKKKVRKKATRVARRPEGDDVVKASVAGGYNDSKLTAEIEKKFGIPIPFLSEEQWEKVSALSGLPVQARFEINIALKRYWYAHLTQTTSPKTAPEIESVCALLEKSGLRLSALASNQDLFKGQILHFDKSAIEQREILEQTCEQIFRAIGVLENCQRRLKRGRGNPSYGPLYELVHHLDFVFYKCLGQKLANSKKPSPAVSTAVNHQKFISSVLEVANLKVAGSTIDKILKSYVNDRDRSGHEYGPAPI